MLFILIKNEKLQQLLKIIEKSLCKVLSIALCKFLSHLIIMFMIIDDN